MCFVKAIQYIMAAGFMIMAALAKVTARDSKS